MEKLKTLFQSPTWVMVENLPDSILRSMQEDEEKSGWLYLTESSQTAELGRVKFKGSEGEQRIILTGYIYRYCHKDNPRYVQHAFKIAANDEIVASTGSLMGELEAQNLIKQVAVNYITELKNAKHKLTKEAGDAATLLALDKINQTVEEIKVKLDENEAVDTQITEESIEKVQAISHEIRTTASKPAITAVTVAGFDLVYVKRSALTFRTTAEDDSAEAAAEPMHYDEFCKQLQAMIDKYFPGSPSSVKGGPTLGRKQDCSATMFFALLPKEKWPNGIKENDPMFSILHFWEFKEGTTDKVKLEISQGGRFWIGGDRVKDFGWKGMTGAPKAVLKRMEKYLSGAAEWLASEEGKAALQRLEEREQKKTSSAVEVISMTQEQAVKEIESYLRGVEFWPKVEANQIRVETKGFNNDQFFEMTKKTLSNIAKPNKVTVVRDSKGITITVDA